MKEFSAAFYKSPAWKKCRESYISKAGGLCERCLAKGIYKAGEIVHHKVHLNPNNISDPSVSLNWDNLELLCRECHGDEHQRLKKRYTIDENGRIAPRKI